MIFRVLLVGFGLFGLGIARAPFVLINVRYYRFKSIYIKEIKNI